MARRRANVAGPAWFHFGEIRQLAANIITTIRTRSTVVQSNPLTGLANAIAVIFIRLRFIVFSRHGVTSSLTN